MSKKERQAYRRGIIDALEGIATIGFFIAIFIAYFI